MLARAIATMIATAVIIGAVTLPAQARIRVYEDGDKFIEMGARLQLQYLYLGSDDGAGGIAGLDRGNTDLLFFRRARPYIAGSLIKNWYGKFAFDFGKAEDANEVAVKDMWFEYQGWKNTNLYIGNSKTPFSREFQTSSTKLQLVERTFTGDHNFGTPDRMLGFAIRRKEGNAGKLTYRAAVGAENHDPGMNRMDLDTPVNRALDWNEGIVVSGRVDWNPLGFMRFDRGDFHTDKWLFNLSAGAYGWWNDGDNNTYTGDDGLTIDPDGGKVDLDRAAGVEFSGGVRGKGLSADAEYNFINGDLVDKTFTGGLYRNGKTDLTKFSVNAGYMVLHNHLELVLGYSMLDADNYEDAWTRAQFGLNWFLHKYNLRFQGNYWLVQNVLGVKDADSGTVLAQGQFLF